MVAELLRLDDRGFRTDRKVENKIVVVNYDIFHRYEITKFPSRVGIVDLKSGNKKNKFFKKHDYRDG